MISIRPASRRAPTVDIRPMRMDDIPGVIALQHQVFPGMPSWNAAQLESHLARFPEGQLVAMGREGRLLGSASSLIVLWADHGDTATWKQVTGDGYFTTHNPRGFTLYGADIGVAPEARGRGVGRRLYEARKQLVKRFKLKRMVAGGRIPGYGRCADEISPEAYVSEVLAGRLHDPVLSFQIANGFAVRGVIPGYLGGDRDSKGFATLLEWVCPVATQLA